MVTHTLKSLFNYMSHRDDQQNHSFNYHSGVFGGGDGGTGSDIALASPGPTAPISSPDEEDPFYVRTMEDVVI